MKTLTRISLLLLSASLVYGQVSTNHPSSSSPVVPAQKHPTKSPHSNKAKVVSLNGEVLISRADGSVEVRSKGTRSWRNNNPGNIRYCAFSIQHGAVGKAGGFAVFPNMSMGTKALRDLLKTPVYQNLTLDETVGRYAPPFENNTAAYRTFVEEMSGIEGTRHLSTLSTDELDLVIIAIVQVESLRMGKVTIKKPGHTFLKLVLGGGAK